MKFTALKADLLAAAGIAVRAVPAHSTMNILECFLIEARGNDICFIANDMELGIETHISGTVEEPGIVAAEAKMLSEIIRKLPDDTAVFETNPDYHITITSGKARFEIGGRGGEDFAYLPPVEYDEGITLTQYTLKNIINQTIFSVAVNENNKIMTGESFEIRDDVLRVVALDGHRIAIRRTALSESFPPKSVIVPGKTLQDISRILTGETDEIVHIYFSDNHIVFEIPGTRVVSRLIDGKYFNVDQMISTDYETKLTVSRSQFLGCIDRATLFVHEGDKKPIILEIDDGEIRLSIESPLGSMNETLEAEKEGKSMTIGFNPRFLMDALKAVEDENVTMYLINSKAPCFIRDEDETYTYLVLPVNFVR